MSKVQKHPKANEQVRRFPKAFVWAHAINGFAFFALYITALPMYTEFFNWLYPVLGGPANARLLHRIFAVIFITPTFILLIFSPKFFFLWMKELITWKARDIAFFGSFVKELFGFNFAHIRQTFFNAGEKINSILQIFCAILVIFSGFTMWLPEYFPRELVQWGYVLHNIGFGLGIAVIVGHIYLSVIHKHSRPGYSGVVTGKVPAWWAKGHYADWYDEEVKKGNFPDLDTPSGGKKNKGA